MIRFLWIFGIAFFFQVTHAQKVTYPAPVQFIYLQIEGIDAKMAFMDVPAQQPHKGTVILFHGKNFNGYYWKNVIPVLSQNGYRVVVPDQVGWGRSDKPNIHYSFHLLALNTKKLLDTLGITKVSVVGHSMGGMLATRFVLMYPQMVNKLVYENPIGLEDYRTFVPYLPIEEQWAKEAKATYETYKKYQQTYYPQWKPEYEQYVEAQAEALNDSNFNKTAWVNAVTYNMIYEQPVVYEFQNIERPTLIVIGQEDRTIVGKDRLTEEAKAKHGQYPQLGRQLQNAIKNAQLVELRGVGHIPHVQVPEVFNAHLLQFLNR